MGIDPELQERLEDLRFGYERRTPVEASKAEQAAAARRADWEVRTGYRRAPKQG